jgi:hypothetical protein
MASTSLMFEDKLDGASNFLSWRVRVTLLLEENVKNVATPPKDPQELVAHNKRVVKAEDFPGPIKLPTGSIFDHKLALSFNCYEKVLLLF